MLTRKSSHAAGDSPIIWRESMHARAQQRAYPCKGTGGHGDSQTLSSRHSWCRQNLQDLCTTERDGRENDDQVAMADARSRQLLIVVQCIRYGMCDMRCEMTSQFCGCSRALSRQVGGTEDPLHSPLVNTTSYIGCQRSIWPTLNFILIAA